MRATGRTSATPDTRSAPLRRIRACERGGIAAWVVAFFIASGVGLGALVGVGCLVRANVCPWEDRPPQTATDGPTLWALNCAHCHGRAGEGGMAPSLIEGERAELTRDMLEALIARGRPLAGMPAFRHALNEEQIAAVARHVLLLRGDDPGDGDPGDGDPGDGDAAEDAGTGKEGGGGS